MSSHPGDEMHGAGPYRSDSVRGGTINESYNRGSTKYDRGTTNLNSHESFH